MCRSAPPLKGKKGGEIGTPLTRARFDSPDQQLDLYKMAVDHRRLLGRLVLFLHGICRQLQYCGSLPGDQVSEQDDRAIREFQRIMVLVGLVGPNPPKSR